MNDPAMVGPVVKSQPKLSPLNVLIGILIGTITGFYTYQYFFVAAPNFSTAFNNSYYSTLGILLYHFYLRLFGFLGHRRQ